VKFLKKRDFQDKLLERFPDHGDGWLYNCLEEHFQCGCYTISARAKLDTLVAKTLKVASTLSSRYPLVSFPNGCAGWRGVAKNRRQSPVELSSPQELSQLLREHIYFRDPKRYEDNYHITDDAFRWVVVFCHHGDWHFFAPSKSVAKVKNA
jgi:hypothetical protein